MIERTHIQKFGPTRRLGTRPKGAVVGHFSRKTGSVICLDHSLDGLAPPISDIVASDRIVHYPSGEKAHIICHDCGKQISS